MPRYIDIEKRMEQWGHLCDSYFPNLPCQRFEDFISEAPTADVVPKSEVVKALNEVELLIIITKEAYKQQMEDAPNELSKQSKRTKWIAFEKFYEQFAELKKKYTEGS